MWIVNYNRVLVAKAHDDTNHRYDVDGKNHKYIFHLDMCVDVCRQFRHLIPNKDYFDVETGVYCHDIIEDARYTYSDVMKLTNSVIATEIAYALQNEKGKTRDERANDKYYQGIRETPYATFAKLCDRIANMRYGKQEMSHMFKTYVNEYKHFKEQLYDEKYKEMFEYIEQHLLK